LNIQITISITRIAPLLNTIAFGGVALKNNSIHSLRCFYFYHLPIGNIKARDTAKVHGRIRKAG